MSRKSAVKKEILIEFVWLIGTGIFSVLMVGFTIGFDSLLNWEIDLQVHDTYFVGSPLSLIVVLALLLDLLALVTKSSFQRFRSNATNFHLIIVTGILLLLTILNDPLFLFFQMKIMEGQQTQGWTVYPPSITASTELQNQERYFIQNGYFLILQISLIVVLTLTSIMAGRRLAKHDA